MRREYARVEVMLSVTDNTSPATPEALEEALDSLISQAYENGVEVADHTFELRHGDAPPPDWEVLILRLAKRDVPPSID